jgi:ubiquinone/menaquinone biosynthesis C-methylase UbiE
MAAKGYKGIGMEGLIARWYDKNASRHSMEQYRTWAEGLSEWIAEDKKILEIAPGPGYLSIELAKRGFSHITGLDISKTFVEIAAENAKSAGVRVDFIQGNASNMPFEQRTFDTIICTSAFKNFSEPVKALQEMHRVLTPHGVAWIGDMRYDISVPAINEYVNKDMKATGFNAFMLKSSFKYFLRKRAYTRDEFIEFISRTGFRDYEIKEMPLGFEISLKK